MKNYYTITLCCCSRYLALVSALASGADWLFIPEAPPKEGWEDRMCARLEGVRHKKTSEDCILASDMCLGPIGQSVLKSEKYRQALWSTSISEIEEDELPLIKYST